MKPLDVSGFLLLAAALTAIGCDDATPASPPAASASAASSALAVAPSAAALIDLPPPAEGLHPVAAVEPNQLACSFFGGGTAVNCKQIRMIANYQAGPSRFLRVFRVVDPKSGFPKPLRKWQFYGKVDKLPSGLSRMEIDDGTSMRFWIISSSIVLEGEDLSANAESLRAEFTPWAEHLVEATKGL